MATRVTTKTALTRQIHFVKWHWRIWNLILCLYCLVADAADTHAVTDRKYSFWVGFFPLFSGSVSWGSKGSLAKKRFMKVRRVSYSSFLIVARDIYQVLQSEDQGFYFYFIFYAVNYRIGGCFFILLICSLEYFFLTTVTSPTWKSWWKVLPIT